MLLSFSVSLYLLTLSLSLYHSFCLIPSRCIPFSIDFIVFLSLSHYMSVFKWANPGLFFVYFQSFQTNKQFLQKINVKNCPSSIRHLDSNPQPFEHEMSPITTRPGLPPKKCCMYFCVYFSVHLYVHISIHQTIIFQ